MWLVNFLQIQGYDGWVEYTLCLQIQASTRSMRFVSSFTSVYTENEKKERIKTWEEICRILNFKISLSRWAEV